VHYIIIIHFRALMLSLSTFYSRKAQDIGKEASSDKHRDSEEYWTISSFTQLLNGASSDDLKFERFF
jgi:hypothetical protein